MRVYLYELSENPKELHFSEQDIWMADAIKAIEESALEKKPVYSVDLEMRQLTDVVMLKGKMDLELGLICSRCANNFEYDMRSIFQCLFTRDQSLTPGATNSGIAYSEPTGATPEDADIEFLEKDYIELADVLKEQIYLRIPFAPLCSEECKGICPTCGQDQNKQPCQCHRIRNSSLANALKNFRNS